MSVCLVFKSPAGQQTVPLDRPVIVGRDASCDVAIDSVRLSRKHAEFTPTAYGVEVRDLESRNGVLVEGKRVESAVLAPGGKVVMGDVSVTVSGTADAPDVVAAPRPPGVAGDPEKTTMLPAMSLEAAASHAAAPVAADETTLLPAGGGDPRLAPPPAPPAPRASASSPSPPPIVQAKPSSDDAGHRSPAASARRLGDLLSFTGRTLALMALVGTAVFLMATVPLLLEQGSALEASAEARVTTLARLLAAENIRSLAAGARLSATLGSVADVGGVRAALVLSPDGRVLAPTEQLDEVVTDLPGFGDIREIRGARLSRAEGMFEAAVSMEDGARRLGVVWVRFDPVQAAGGRGAGGGVLFASYLLGLIATAAGTLVVRRMVTSRMEAFAVDVDLAVGDKGELAGARNSLPGMPKVAETIDYMLERIKAPDAHGPTAARSEPSSLPRARPAGRPATRSQPAAPSAAEEGSLTVDAGFVVKGADPRGLALVGAGGTPITGKHVLEAIPDQQLVTGIIDCIAGLDQGATSSHAFEVPVGEGVREIEATRSSDGLIHLAIRSS